MNRLLNMHAIKLCMVLVVVYLVTGCSHLNVEFDSSWASRQVSVVVVEHQYAPDDVTTADIHQILTRSGWQVVTDVEQAQARVVCRWTRQPDLNAESEPIEAIKSFHVQVISIEQPKMLAVSDYFYSNTNEDLLPGVESALLAITQAVIPASEPVAPVVTNKVPVASPIAPVVKVDSPVTIPVSAEPPSLTKPTYVAPVTPSLEMSAEQPAVEPVIDTPSVVTEAMILPLEPAQVVEPIEPIQSTEPVSMETSPWVPRFQGMGLENWGKE